jgi:hypothetical protein
MHKARVHLDSPLEVPLALFSGELVGLDLISIITGNPASHDETVAFPPVCRCTNWSTDCCIQP